MNRLTQQPNKIRGKGSFTPPPGLTQEECERLAREADEARAKEPAQ